MAENSLFPKFLSHTIFSLPFSNIESIIYDCHQFTGVEGKTSLEMINNGEDIKERVLSYIGQVLLGYVIYKPWVVILISHGVFWDWVRPIRFWHGIRVTPWILDRSLPLLLSMCLMIMPHVRGNIKRESCLYEIGDTMRRGITGDRPRKPWQDHPLDYLTMALKSKCGWLLELGFNFSFFFYYDYNGYVWLCV